MEAGTNLGGNGERRLDFVLPPRAFPLLLFISFQLLLGLSANTWLSWLAGGASAFATARTVYNARARENGLELRRNVGGSSPAFFFVLLDVTKRDPGSYSSIFLPIRAFPFRQIGPISFMVLVCSKGHVSNVIESPRCPLTWFFDFISFSQSRVCF